MDYIEIVEERAVPERSKLIIEAYSFMSELGHRLHQEQIEELIMTGDELPGNSLILNIEQTLSSNLHYLLTEHGIRLDLDSWCPLNFMLAVLKGVVALGNVEDTAQIEAIVNGDEDHEEMLQALLELTDPTRLDWSKLDQFLDYVDPALFAQLTRLGEVKRHSEDQTIDITWIRDRALSYVKEIPASVVLEFIETVGHVGHDLMSVADLLADAMDEKSPEDIAGEALILTLTSNTREDILEEADRVVELWCGDDDMKITKISVAISKMYKE